MTIAKSQIEWKTCSAPDRQQWTVGQTPKGQLEWENNFKIFFFLFFRVVHNRFFFFFSLFVWPHATSRILRTSEKKQGSVRISRKCDGVGKVGDVKPQDYIQEKLSRITKRKWEVTLYLSEGELGRTDENITWTQYFSWPVRLRASFDLHKKEVKKHLLNSGSLFFFPPQTSSFFF